MLAWETTDDTPYIKTAMVQIAAELCEKYQCVNLIKDEDLKFSDFEGIMYDLKASTTAQSAILQRAATLKHGEKRLA